MFIGKKVNVSRFDKIEKKKINYDNQVIFKRSNFSKLQRKKLSSALLLLEM